MDFGVDIENLVERAQSGNSDAFGEIFDLFLTAIYRYVYFRVDTKEDAEDITEEIFLKAWKNINQFQKINKTPFSAWLFQIAKNNVTDFYRHKKSTVEIPIDKIDIDSQKKLIQKTENDIERARLNFAIKQLPVMQADAISLKFFSELSNSEIALILNKSEGAIRILLSRGLKSLKKVLKE